MINNHIDYVVGVGKIISVLSKYFSQSTIASLIRNNGLVLDPSSRGAVSQYSLSRFCKKYNIKWEYTLGGREIGCNLDVLEQELRVINPVLADLKEYLNA